MVAIKTGKSIIEGAINTFSKVITQLDKGINLELKQLGAKNVMIDKLNDDCEDHKNNIDRATKIKGKIEDIIS